MSQEDTPAGQEPAATTTEVEVKETKTFDEEYVKSLRNENARYRTEAQEVKQRLQELEERDASEIEKAQRKATRAEQEAAEARSKLIRYEVATKKGLPQEFIPRLQGSTHEELEADADELLSLVKSRPENTQEPNFDGGAREPAPEPRTPEDQHNIDVLKMLGIST